jgi:hypothetical protein
MRNELQYRSEWCPCSGASADTVELQGARSQKAETKKGVSVKLAELAAAKHLR